MQLLPLGIVGLGVRGVLVVFVEADLVVFVGEFWRLLGLGCLGLGFFGFCDGCLLEIAEIVIVLLGLLLCFNHLRFGLLLLFYFFLGLDRLFFLDLRIFDVGWCVLY